jgi:hypothetical protein
VREDWLGLYRELACAKRELKVQEEIKGLNRLENRNRDDLNLKREGEAVGR